MTLKAVTFDFWGTLVDAGHDLRAQRAELLCRYLPDCSLERALQAYARAWAEFTHEIDQGYGLTPQTVLSLTLDDLDANLAPPDRTAVLRAWQEATLRVPPPLLPGVRGVLRELRGRGLLIGLISDTGVSPGRVLRQFLASKGLIALFDWMTFSDETGVTKRRPQAFLYTLRALGVRPEEAMHVGDLPSTDVEGARAAGMHTALVLESSARREAIPLADIVLERIRYLPSALAQWEARQARQ